jgi:hypothetical protein
VRELLDKELIREVLYMCCRVLDRSDVELLKSAYHPEGFNVHGPNFVGNAHDFCDWVVPRLRVHEAIRHSIGNVLIDLRGAGTGPARQHSPLRPASNWPGSTTSPTLRWPTGSSASACSSNGWPPRPASPSPWSKARRSVPAPTWSPPATTDWPHPPPTFRFPGARFGGTARLAALTGGLALSGGRTMLPTDTGTLVTGTPDDLDQILLEWSATAPSARTLLLAAARPEQDTDRGLAALARSVAAPGLRDRLADYVGLTFAKETT